MKLPELYRLIQVLTPEEKAALDDHFRNNGYDSQNLYRQFFDYLLGYSGRFDEGKFNQFIQNLGIQDSTLRIYRERIYDEVCEVLTLLHSKEDLVLAIRQHLRLAKSFILKKHFVAARKELKKAQKKEDKIKHPASRFEIETTLAHILFLEDRKNIDKLLQAHHEVAVQAAADFSRDANIYLGYQQLFRQGTRQKGEDMKESLQTIIDFFDSIERPADANLETRIYYTSAKIRIAYECKRSAEIYDLAKELYQVFNTNPTYKESQQHSYFTTLDHYLSGLNMRLNFTEMKQVLENLTLPDGYQWNPHKLSFELFPKGCYEIDRGLFER